MRSMKDSHREEEWPRKILRNDNARSQSRNTTEFMVMSSERDCTAEALQILPD
jgi:hypothetical protein